MSTIKKPCNWPGCNKLVSYDDGYCLHHLKAVAKKKRKEENRKANEYRKKTGPRVYDKQNWKRVSKMKRNEYPFCERCGKLTELVHHKDRNKDNWNWDNLESLCNLCHTKEHRHDYRKDLL